MFDFYNMNSSPPSTYLFKTFLCLSSTVDLQSLLSAISRKIKSIFGTSSPEYTAEGIDLDIVALNIDKDCLQVSEMCRETTTIFVFCVGILYGFVTFVV